MKSDRGGMRYSDEIFREDRPEEMTFQVRLEELTFQEEVNP